MNKSGFPRGNPPDDCRKLELWWQEEMRKCGLSGGVTVEHDKMAGHLPERGIGKQLIETFVMRTAAAVNQHMYFTVIPGAPWPLEAAVMTTASGTITEILYRAVLKHSNTGKVVIRKSMGLVGHKIEVQGPGADRFRDAKPLLKQIKDGLSRRYDPPQWGFVASKKYIELKTASLNLRECAAGTEAIVQTTVREENTFAGHDFSLGLNRVIEIFKCVEHPEWA